MPTSASRLRHAAVAHDRLGLVVAVGEHLVDAERARQARDLVLGAAMAHDQPATAAPGRARHGIERSIELDEAGVDELDAAIAARGQRVEDGGIEDEGAVHAISEAQGVMERGVIEAAQVAAEPDKGGRHGFVQDKKSPYYRRVRHLPTHADPPIGVKCRAWKRPRPTSRTTS